MKLVQVELTNLVHPEKMICWIPTTFKKHKIKEGEYLTLEHVVGMWKIEKMFDTVIEHQEINYKWPVGGL